MNPQYSKEAVLEAQVQRLQEKLLESSGSQLKLQHLKGVQAREKEEWKESRRVLEEKLASARRECDTLRKKEWRRDRGGYGSSREVSDEPPPAVSLHRTFSSQSLPAHTYSADVQDRESSCPTPPSSLHNYPLSHHSRFKPTSTPYSSYLGNGASHAPLSGRSLITGSNSSIGSASSAHSHLDDYRSNFSSLYRHSRVQGPFSSTPFYHPTVYSEDDVHTKKSTSKSHRNTSRLYGHTPSGLSDHTPTESSQHQTLTPSDPDSGTGGSQPPHRSEPSSPDLELQRSKLKVKQLEREASLLEQQLSDKTSSARGHVEELMLLRTQLAQEKASFAIVKQELQDKAAREVGVAKAAHVREVKRLGGKLKAETAEKDKVVKKLEETSAKLKRSEAECGKWRERLRVLEQEGAEQREQHARAWGELQAEVGGGVAQVASLEEALRSAKAEAQAHLTRLEAEAREHQAHSWESKQQISRLSEEVRMKDAGLARLSQREAELQQELERVKEELKQGHTSWQRLRKELNEQLFESEVARESLFKQLAETGRKLTFHSAQVEGKREAMLGELDRCRAEMSRLEGVVREEMGRSKKAELEVESWKLEAERAGQRCREAERRQKEVEKRWGEERRRKEASELEGESLRQEVGRLSETLRACQQQLQAEREGKVGRERDTEDTLAHLQQELAKRAEQVLEMDRLLQNHQAETTARRLQLERTLSQRQGELKQRTQEVESLTSQASEDQTTIAELRAELLRAKEDQRSLFSGSQAQLLAQGSKVTSLEANLQETKAALEKVSREAKQLRSEVSSMEERERECRVRCEELQSQVKSLTNENDSLHAKHLCEVEDLQALHMSQLNSRKEQAEVHHQQLEQVARQEKARQEELSRCRTQVASLTAELAAEKGVAEESRKLVLAARAETSHQQAQVAKLQTTVSVLQSMLEKQVVDMVPTSTHGTERKQTTPTNGLVLAGMTSDLEFLKLPNHVRITTPLTTPTTTRSPTPPPSSSMASPPDAVTPPTPKNKGGIISM